MKIVFYSEECNYCKKLLEYITSNNLDSYFKLIDINKNEVPVVVDIVPMIIDTDLNQPLKTDKAFEYVINIKYFNNPTNNINNIKELPPNPSIDEDELAMMVNHQNLEIKDIKECANDMVQYRQKQDIKLSTLLRKKR